MENEMAIYETEKDLIMARPPEVILKEAMQAAKALGDVVSKKKKPVIMNGEQYLEFEDWQTVGRFYGITAKVIETKFIDYGNAQGFEAKAVAIRQDGQEISAAEAMCLNDEDKWSTRPKYEYVNNVRTKVGDVPVPLFQLKSMAQTRACAKALRNVLAWVVVLAGYKPTPAEEMTGNEKQPIQEPKKKPPEEPGKTDNQITVAVEQVEIKTGKHKDTIDKEGKKIEGKPWILYIVHAGGEKYNTFSQTFGELAQRSFNEKLNVVISSSKTEKGKKLENLLILEGRQPGEEDGSAQD